MKIHFFLLILFSLFLNSFIVAQSVEVQGQLKINKTEKSITNDSVLVKQSDGSVGVKDAYKIDSGCSLNIGDSYEGGIIYYLDGSNCHGLIIDSVDQVQSRFSLFDFEYGTNLDYLYSGKTNTIRIINGRNGTDTAANVCYTSSNSGFTDWYLPSLIELSIVYYNLIADKDYSNISDGNYWSSTEQDLANAGTVNLSTGQIIPNNGKRVLNNVRCIRSF